jgi:hypothetical protein
MREMKNIYSILVRRSEVKRQLGRPGHRWEDNIRWVLRKYGGKLWTGCIWLRIRTSGGLL